MEVKISKSFQVRAPIDRVWEFLADPRKVAPCVPGAQITEAVDDRTYRGTISVKVGPVVTNYKGEVTLSRLDERDHAMELVGRGQDVGGKGSASMRMTGQLRALADGNTEVASQFQISVVGPLAQFGARLMQNIADQMFAQFTANLTRSLQALENPEAEAKAPQPQSIKAIPLVLTAIWQTAVGFFRRWLGRSK